MLSKLFLKINWCWGTALGLQTIGTGRLFSWVPSCEPSSLGFPWYCHHTFVWCIWYKFGAVTAAWPNRGSLLILYSLWVWTDAYVVIIKYSTGGVSALKVSCVLLRHCHFSSLQEPLILFLSPGICLFEPSWSCSTVSHRLAHSCTVLSCVFLWCVSSPLSPG